jgi:hypothetical protein
MSGEKYGEEEHYIAPAAVMMRGKKGKIIELKAHQPQL